MKLFTGIYKGKSVLGVIANEASKCILFQDLGLNYGDLNEFIISGTKSDYEILKNAGKCEDKLIDFSEIKLCAPIPYPLQDIICLGINYLDHAEESARFKKEAFERERSYPVYFSKRVNEAIGDGDEIIYNREAYEQLDYEAELAVIIGRDAKNVKQEDALDYVFGYTILNDMSARDVQIRHKQWYFGKSMDGFTPMGPVIITVDEFDGIPNLRITSKVNGEIRQQSETGLQQFDIAHVIEELSRGFTLKAGTIISTGTPAGVGMGFEPPKFLQVGDVVECEIEKIGRIRNKII